MQVKPGYSEPLNLYTVTVLPPASRKSAVFAAVAAPLHEWEAREAQRMAPVLAERELLEADVQRAKKAYEHVKTPEQREDKEADYLARKRELDAIRVPAAPRVTVDDVTPEKLASLMAEQGGSLAVMSAEGGVFKHMAGRYSNGVPNLDVYLKGHAGDPLRVDRQGRASEHIPAPALTMGLAVQPDVLRGLSRKPGFVGRGLMARFLYALPASTVGYRDTDPPPVPPPVSEAYRRKVAALCDLTPAQTQGGATPNVLTLSAEAYGLYRQMERDREAMLRPGGKVAGIPEWGGKLTGAVIRIAGLLHLAEQAGHAAPWGSPMSADTLGAAWTIGQYLIPHALAAQSEMGKDETTGEAQAVLAWLEQRDGGTAPFTKRDAFRALRGRFNGPDALDKPLSLLVSHGYIRECAAERTGPGRKPSPVYEVNPHYRTQADTGR